MRERQCADCQYFMHLHFASHPALEVEICTVTGEMRELGKSCRKIEKDPVKHFSFRVKISEINGGRAGYC